MLDADQRKIFSKNLNNLIAENGKTQKEIADAIHVSPQTFNTWCKGIALPRMGKVQALADYFYIKKSDLLEEHDDSPADSLPFPKSVMDKFGFKPVKTIRLPLLDYVACGEPRFMNEDYETYVEADADIKADYCLKAKGDSMIDAHIFPGSILFIRKCDMVDFGDIAVVAIGDEATLKRVYYYREENLLKLVPENPMYKPLVYSGAELDRVRILGKVVRVQFTP